MRWDYGQVYKMIRKSKGLTQNDVCGEIISRSTLAKIESGKVIPNFDNMVFLLEQIDMSLSEFKYICNEFKPDQRERIITTIQSQNSTIEVQDLLPLLKDCENFLKTHHDVPIQNLYRSLQVITEIRIKGLKSNDYLHGLATSIWKHLEPMDSWYGNDLRLLAIILFYFDMETLPHITKRILENLERYKNFHDIKSFQLSLLGNLSTIYFKNHHFKQCESITLKSLEIAQELKRFDALGFSQVRLGICQNDDELISKGMTLLKLTGENQLVTTLEEEIEEYNHFNT
ncbi:MULTISPECIES: Rgg/GadR/MutR family transcriptional regulator [Streptococcus]|uniref:Rgg/GadR/MutR family transcriptional regulator n=2 Tax=Streptococcus TaxID=1301 RepID=A0A3L9DY65_9STRE|nr:MULTISPECIES: Rgg/GadR/MutR family transcriptional regulator [Streptococcus]RLY04132.1 Rgg/GadR/MutR family transcriptional regulator [Streptococcus hillyeri]